MSKLTPARPLPPKNPLIVVIGATGTGKSKLAVSLARRFNGEIINADAMQMYKGLPVITNKMPEHERGGIPHHMLDFIGLEEKPWTVRHFVDEAKVTIDQIRGRGKVPVVVGGTGYYVYGLLVKDGLLGTDENGEGEEWGQAGEGEEKFRILQGSAEEMYAKLMELDPITAKNWHPKDTRRIQRTLEICLKTGKKASEFYQEQQDAKTDREQGVERGLHYDALLLWLEAEDSVLKERLNRRVDAMVADGLLDEASELFAVEQNFKQREVAFDKGKGIWVSIGFKELESWAEIHAADPARTTGDSKLALECLEAVKAGTRQYAKRQHRYVRIRLANALKEAGELDKLFLLDSTDLIQWKDSVESQSEQLVSAFLEGSTLPDPSTLSDLAKQTFSVIEDHDQRLSKRISHRCETCDKTLMTEKEWQQHLASRTHKNTVQSQRRKALQVWPVAAGVDG